MLASGFTIGLEQLVNLEFDPNAPYRACLICGALFQSDLDRNPQSLADMLQADQQRSLWAKRHGKTHSDKEHELLRKSQRSCTPEAAVKLAAFGIIDVTGLVMDNEMEHAYREAPAVPKDDAEGV